MDKLWQFRYGADMNPIFHSYKKTQIKKVYIKGFQFSYDPWGNARIKEADPQCKVWGLLTPYEQDIVYIKLREIVTPVYTDAGILTNVLVNIITELPTINQFQTMMRTLEAARYYGISEHYIKKYIMDNTSMLEWRKLYC